MLFIIFTSVGIVIYPNINDVTTFSAKVMFILMFKILIYTQGACKHTPQQIVMGCSSVSLVFYSPVAPPPTQQYCFLDKTDK